MDMDPNVVYQHLLLSKELVGHPALPHLKTMVDAFLVKANADAKVVVDKAAAEAKAQAAIDAAKAAHEAQAAADRKAAEEEMQAKRAAYAPPGAAPPPAVKREVVNGLPGPAEKA